MAPSRYPVIWKFSLFFFLRYFFGASVTRSVKLLKHFSGIHRHANQLLSNTCCSDSTTILDPCLKMTRVPVKCKYTRQHFILLAPCGETCKVSDCLPVPQKTFRYECRYEAPLRGALRSPATSPVTSPITRVATAGRKDLLQKKK